jgi:hypothetical protein
VREWHGTTHRVTVIDDAYRFDGKRYGSLSEVARTITGSRWSRPLFFGLKLAQGSSSMSGISYAAAGSIRANLRKGVGAQFNSLHAQREACQTFIRSQAGEGWRLIKTHHKARSLSDSLQVAADGARGDPLCRALVSPLLVVAARCRRVARRARSGGGSAYQPPPQKLQHIHLDNGGSLENA